MRNRICTVSDCDTAHFAKGYCLRHYKVWQRNGTPISKPQQGSFNDTGLDELHRSDPYREFSLDEIAKALGTQRQTVWAIERRALKKMRDEFLRRGVYF